MNNKFIIRVYADLIIKGEKKIDEVPAEIREQVKKFLAD